MKKILFFLFTTLPLLSQANTFFCAGRMGPFEVTFTEATLKIAGTGGSFCTLREDKTFNSDERSFFQVLGAYDNSGEELKKLNLPELISPDGYVSYIRDESNQINSNCNDVFNGNSFRNLYIQKEMRNPTPSRFQDSVINVFKTDAGWPILFLNDCIQAAQQN